MATLIGRAQASNYTYGGSTVYLYLQSQDQSTNISRISIDGIGYSPYDRYRPQGIITMTKGKIRIANYTPKPAWSDTFSFGMTSGYYDEELKIRRYLYGSTVEILHNAAGEAAGILTAKIGNVEESVEFTVTDIDRALVRIYNGSSFGEYKPYIYKNGAWQRVVPMVFTDGSWITA